MKNIFTLSLFFVSLNIFGQQTIFELPKEINTTKTSSHVNIPGTNVFIIPQGSFKVNGIYLPGMYDSINNTTAIWAYEDHENAYKFLNLTNNTPLTPSSFKVVYSEGLKVDGYTAEYNFATPDSKTTVGTLLFGDSTFVVKLTIFINSGDSTNIHQVLEILKTIYYDKDSKINLFANAVFTVDDSKSVYKFLKKKKTVYVFSKNGNEIKFDSGYDSHISISQVPDFNAKNIVDGILEGLTDTISKTSFTVLNPKIEKHDTTINELSCYEAKIKGQYKSNDVLIYVQAFTIEKMVVLCEGLSYSDFENFIAEFNKLSNTIKKK